MNKKSWTLALLMGLFHHPAAAEYFNGKAHQTVTLDELKTHQQAFENELDQTTLWQAIEDLPIGVGDEFTTPVCEQHMATIDQLLDRYFYSLQLQKLAMDCHNLLSQDAHAAAHETNLLTLAQLVTATGDGKELDSAFWITDIHSAYEFLDLAGFTVIDGELMLHNKQTYLAALVQGEDVLAEFRYFKMNQFFKGINDTVGELLDEEEMHFFKVMDLVLKTELKDNEGLFTLAYADITEAQLLLAKLLLGKTDKFPTLYGDALHLFTQAAQNGSVIAKYNQAYRIFIDEIEDQYTTGHELITEALSARYGPALTLAAIVREKKLGIKKDRKTVEELISLMNERGKPGAYELMIGSFMLSDRIWNNQKLARKYLDLATAKNNPKAMMLYGIMYQHGYGVNQSDKQAHQWFVKATKHDATGEALIKVATNQIEGTGTKKDIPKAIENFIKAAQMGATKGHVFAGQLLYSKNHGVTDHKRAVAQFQLGHEQGESLATQYLAKALFHGHGIAQDRQRAFELFQQIADEGLLDTEIYLAVAHFNGWGTIKDQAQGAAMFRRYINSHHSSYVKRENLILANMNLRLSYAGEHLAETPHDDLVANLTAQAANHDASAMYKLGYLNYVKFAPEMTREAGVTWLKKAAAGGVAQAHNQLAEHYKWQRADEPVQYHRNQARQLGDPEALYDRAQDILNDQPTEGLALMEQAAEHGLIFAINKLAEIHHEGKLVAVDPSKSLHYSQMAYAAGDNHALRKTLDLYTDHLISQEQMGDALELLEAEAEESQSTSLMRELAEFYANESLPEYDPERVVHWYVRAFEAGDKEAVIELGKRYMYGIQLNQNFELAQFFFTNAAAKRKFTWNDLVDEPGSFWVALMLQKGLGVEQNLEAARQIYASNFHSSRKKEAKNNYAVMTCQAEKTDKKERKAAFELIQDLSSQSRTVMFNLGWMYEHGICTKQDLAAAKSAYQQAAEQNSPHALYRLHQLHQSGQLFEPNETLAAEYLARSINTSKKVTYHNMMSTFLDLPYIKNLKLDLPAPPSEAPETNAGINSLQ